MNRSESLTELQQPPLRASLVSVVMPTYNRARLLPAAVRSVLDQRWTDVEVVVVDDGSRDNTREVVEALRAEDDRVRYLPQQNGGVSAARNTALRNSRGAFIAFLDSDDVWHSWKLEAQMAILAALPEVGMVWSDMHAIDMEGTVVCRNYLRRMYQGYEKLKPGQLFSHTASVGELAPQATCPQPRTAVSWGHIYNNMLSGNLVHTSTVVLRRERAAGVGPFDETMRAGGEDYKYHLATTRLGSVAFLDCATIDYRIGGNDQITDPKNQVNFATSFLKTLDEQLALYRDELNLTDRELATIRADAHDWLASALIETGDRRQAASHALRAIRQRPLTPTAWKTLAKTMLPRTAVDLVRAARRLRTGSTAASM